MLKPCTFSSRSADWAGDALRVQHPRGLAKSRAGHFNRGDEVGISRDDDGCIETILKTVQEKVCGKIDGGSLFLGFENLNGLWWR